MADVKPITVLHLSDMQFGAHHRFGVTIGPEGNNPYDTLRERLILDLRQLRKEHGLAPDLMILTGDLAEWGLPSEFDGVLDLIQGLERELNLTRDRTIIIPGNHDINRNDCEAYFKKCSSKEKTPIPPYTPKWENYIELFGKLYHDLPKYVFSEEQYWTLFELKSLKVVVAGLNSTIAESHLEKDDKGEFGHYGWVGEPQCHWFAERLANYEHEGWLRIGAVHHNVVRGAAMDDENLRDADDLKRFLGPRLNCVLHGHTHEADISFWIDRNVPTLSTGSAAVDRKARPEEVPNQYQILQFWPDRMVQYSRAYDPRGKSWIADARIGKSEVSGRQTEEVGFRSVGATFPPPVDAAAPASADKGRESKLDPFDLGRRDDFLSRIEQICRLRSPENTQIERIDAQPLPYLRVTERQFGIATSYPLGGSDLSLTFNMLEQFAAIHESYRRADPGVRSTFVQGGGCGAELAEATRKRGIRLVSFVEYQGLIDFSRYLDEQTRRLEQDSVYPPKLYVPQRMRMEIGFDSRESEDALATMQEMMVEPYGRFILVLGDFGSGKTFLLRELARRMAADGAPIAPVLVEMRALEKGRTLDELIAQHLVRHGIEPEIKRFRYMLKSGRIALLFDGFDELALRVTYANATEHLKTVIEAANGEGKVVVTSRTQHFLSDQQVRTVLGQQVESVSGQRIIHLLPFEEPQIRLFLRNRLSDDASANARFELIDKVKDLLGLSKNPRMLSFIAGLPEQDLLAAKDAKGEISAASLYQKILDHWLDGEIARVTPKGSAPSLSKDDLWLAVTDLALRLWKKTDPTASVSELTEHVATTLAKLKDPRADLDHATFRIGSGTLLVRDENGAFGFIHQSMLEWLVAREAARQIESGSPDVLGQREMSPLMADFFGALAENDTAIVWAKQALSQPGESSLVTANALLVLRRSGESTATRGKSFVGEDLKGRDFSGQDLSFADFRGADLTDALFVDATLEGTNFAGTRLVGTDLSRARLPRAELQRADLTRANLMGTDLRGTQWEGAVLRQTRLVGAILDDKTLAEAQVFGAALSGPAPKPEILWAASCLAVAWSPDGSLLATAEGSCIRLWEASSGRTLRTLEGHQDWVRSVTFSPDGATLASASDDKTVRLWEASSGRLLDTLEGHWQAVFSVAFSPDGTTLASASDDKTVGLWAASSGRPLLTIEGHRRGVRSVRFSPDGAILASASDDKTVGLWAASSGRPLPPLEGHRQAVFSVAFNPDGGATLASASDDSTVRLWETSSGRPLRTLKGHRHAVWSVAFSPDGATLASASEDTTVRLWEASSGRPLRSLEGHQQAVFSVAFNPDSTMLASASDDKTVRLWEGNSGRPLRTLKGHQQAVWSVAFSPDADGAILASASDDNTVRLWEASSGRLLHTLVGHQQAVLSVAFSPDGATLASASYDNTVRLWAASSGRPLRSLEGHQHWVRSVAFNRDGTTLASASYDNTVRLWEAASGRALRTLAGHRRAVSSVAFSPDGTTLASASDDNTVRLWEASSGRTLRSLEDHRRAVSSVAFSPDGTTLASASADNTVQLWETATGLPLRTLEGHQQAVSSVAFSPDGATLASASADNTVRLWEARSRRPLRTLKGHQHWVWSVAFSPDGATLASASFDNTVRLWEVASGRCYAVLVHLPEGWAAFSPDGRYKLGGDLAGGFWHVIGLCRFEPGELDPYIPGLRMADDAPFLPA